MNRILCSTGALIGPPNGWDFTLLRKYIGRLECDGYEFLMYGAWHEQADCLQRFLNALPISIPVFHVEKYVGDLLSRNADGDTEKALMLFRQNCALARDIGAEKLVVHLWGGLDSDKVIGHNFEYYKYLRQISDAHSLVLTVENIVCNVRSPMEHLTALTQRYPDIQFTFDTKMAAFHGQLDLLYKAENRSLFSHIRHMHINDYGGGYKEWKKLRTLHIGEGNIDFDRLFQFVCSSDYCGDFTVEATSYDQNGTIDFESLNDNFRKIREYTK